MDQTLLENQVKKVKRQIADIAIPGLKSQLAEIMNYRQCTNKGYIYLSGLSDGVDTGGTYRNKYTVVSNSSDIKLVFGNFYNSDGMVYDRPNPDDITVKASIEIGAGIYPLKFNGSDHIVIKGGAVIESDPLAVELAAGTQIYVRTYVSVESGKKYPGGMYCDNTAGEGKTTGDITVSGTPTSSGGKSYHPLCIIGKTKGTSVLLVGDSIMNGAYDSGYVPHGFAVRACGTTQAYISVAKDSDSAQLFQGTNRIGRMALAKYCSHAIVEYGVNDFAAGQTFAQMKANLLNIYNALALRGIKVFATTLTPITTSTDSWATVENQTPSAATLAARAQTNAWIRTLPAPLSGYFETADTVETERDSGVWEASNTGDGIHPSATGYIAMGTAIDTNKFK